MVGQLDHKIIMSLSLLSSRLNLNEYRLGISRTDKTDAFEEHGRTLVESSVIELQQKMSN